MASGEAWAEDRQRMADDSIIYYTLQCEVWLDISAGGLKSGSSAGRVRLSVK